MSTMLSRALAGVAALSLALSAAPALAAGEGAGVIDHDWSFEGPLGTYDQAELRRGWQIYQEVCSSCHGLKYLAFRHLGEEGGPAFAPDDVKAIASSFEIPTLDQDGEPTTRPGTPSDEIRSPYANEAAARSANGGALPPDLSLITKSRSGYSGVFTQVMQGAGGPEYVYSLLMGYQEEPPTGFDPGDLYYNRYFHGHRIAMAAPLYEEGVEYKDGARATVKQMAHDVTAFLTWAGDPLMNRRKEAGMRNILFLILFAVLVWYSNKKLWAPVKRGEAVWR